MKGCAAEGTPGLAAERW